MKLTNKSAFWLILSSIIILSYFIFVPAIPQSMAYHNFIDDKTLVHIPNFMNVASNIPFLLVGGLGLIKLYVNNSFNYITQTKYLLIIFFISIMLVSVGSSYYHLNPNNFTLVWDRLPITFGFMALFSLVVAEFINIKLGLRIFIPLILYAITSIVYWQYTESIGESDLKAYILVQAIPILFFPIVLIFKKNCYHTNLGYWLVLCFYVLSKIAEFLDMQIYSLTSVISGHSLKHLLAALGIYFLIRMYESRKLK